MARNYSPYYEDDRVLMGSDDEVREAARYFNTNETGEMVRIYLEEDIPSDLRKSKMFQLFWATLGKTVKLTFLEKDDLLDFEADNEDAMLTFKMMIPSYEYTFNEMISLEQIKLYFNAAIKRARGFTTHKYNERMILGSQTQQIIRTNTENMPVNTGEGGIRGLFKKFF